jgi:hypothetical protein
MQEKRRREPRRHTGSVVCSSRMKTSHMYNLKMYLWQEAQRYFRWPVIEEISVETALTTWGVAISGL